MKLRQWVKDLLITIFGGLAVCGYMILILKAHAYGCERVNNMNNTQINK